MIGRILRIVLVFWLVGAVLATALPLADLGKNQVSAEEGVSHIPTQTPNPDVVEIANIEGMEPYRVRTLDGLYCLTVAYVGNTMVDLEIFPAPGLYGGSSYCVLYRDGSPIKTITDPDLQKEGSRIFCRDTELSKGVTYTYEVGFYDVKGKLLYSETSSAKTGDVYGRITVDSTWTAADGSYDLIDLVWVSKEATLTITPATMVNDANLLVHGTLCAEGASFSAYSCEPDYVCDAVTVWSGAAHAIINHCTFQGGGIDFGWSNNNVVSDTTISNCTQGISLVCSNGNSMTGNRITKCDYGVFVSDCHNNVLDNNSFYEDSQGIVLSAGSGDNVLASNNLSNSEYCGIALSGGSSNNTIVSNNITNSGDGIRATGGSTNNVIVSNVIENNSQGIVLWSSNDNLVYNNYLRNNDINAIDNGSNAWNIAKTPGTNIIGGPYLGGNYWSDYRGTDVDGDGLGDTQVPYNSLGEIEYGGDVLPLALAVKFLDKDNMQRVVMGATADGESRVVIQISPLPPDTDIKDVSVQITAEGDGHLENDAVIQGSVFTQTYTAPEHFVRGEHPGDLTQGKREVALGIKIRGAEIAHEPLYLGKAPVVLLHGLWSNSACWSELLHDLKQNGFKYAVAYSYPNSVHFEENNRVVRNAVQASLNLARSDRLVAKKADVVCHSMGGLIAKKYGDQTYIKSITTVGTPHYGSPLADMLCQMVGCVLPDEELNLAQRFVAWCMDKTGHPARNGAVEDLRENGGIHCPASQLDVDTHVIAGISPLTEQSTILFVNLLSRVFKFYGLLEATATVLELNQLIFRDEGNNWVRNDWVVSESSQEGGIGGQDDYVLWHCSEPTDSEIRGKILDILNGDGEGIQITSLLTESGGVKEPWFWSEELQMNLSPGEVQIMSPQETEMFEPGDAVDIEVNVSDANAMVLIVTSIGESMLIDQSPYEFQFIVPEDSIGGLSISAAARNATGFIGWDEVTVSISVDSSLTELVIYPETSLIYLESGMSLPLALYGLYDDGVKREITSSSCGTLYASTNSAVASISSEGLITAGSAGNSTIAIENSGIGKELAVVVTTGETGDVNSDGHVNVLDMILISQHWGQTGTPGWIPEDVNKDGAIDVLDMIKIGQHWTG